MFAGRSMALPVCIWPPRTRDDARRSPEPTVAELVCAPPDPEAMRAEEPEEDSPELALGPLRDEAEPDLLLDLDDDDDEGVREPEGAWARGGSTTRAGSGALDPEDPPEDPDDPDEPEPELLGRGIA
ncbi:MAG: hypothetical protein ABIP90_10975 [Vicinamibacterales bacterium]